MGCIFSPAAINDVEDGFADFAWQLYWNIFKKFFATLKNVEVKSAQSNGKNPGYKIQIKIQNFFKPEDFCLSQKPWDIEELPDRRYSK